MHPPVRRFAKKSLSIAAAALAVTALPFAVQALVKPHRFLPAIVDVRGAANRPLGPVLQALTAGQTLALKSLQHKVGAALTVQYNGLTGTPRHLFARSGVLTAASKDAPELIARRFLRDNRGLFRFSDEDLDGLRLRTRSTVPGIDTTVMVFEQTVGGVPVYQGDVLINVSRAGEIISVGNDNYPQLSVTNRRSLSAAQAVSRAAARLGVSGYSPASLGLKPVLSTYGQLAPEYVETESFAADRQFGDEIHATPVVFALGATARQAWKVNLTDMAHYGAMWENVVDAESGEVLASICLTAFDAPPGNKGGGVGVGRRATFRPDVQDALEANNINQTAFGKVFDTMPSILSGADGFGRSTRSGPATNYQYTQPSYGADTLGSAANGYSFRYLLLASRNENGLPFKNATPAETFTQALLPSKLGEVTRGFPDAANPSAGSPFGWFYLPTDTGGQPVLEATTDHATSIAHGYTMAAEAATRNKVFVSNGPNADGTQPYSSTTTTLANPVTLVDGRVLGSVIQSNYTEGNNVVVADDRNNDNDATRGIRGYSANRQFSSPFFTYTAAYEYGGLDATSDDPSGASPTATVTFPTTSNPDVPPGTVSLFSINNIEHDYLYGIGFNEAMWNFQQDNFGKGGAGGDAVIAEAMDGSGTDNANFGPTADGTPPRMQMYLFTESSFARRSDGSFDWDVVAHEFYHGVSVRSASKGAGGCLSVGAGLTGESGGQGEGWSDTIASSLSDDDAEGEYVTGKLDIAIRRLPYTNYRWSYGSLNGAVLRRRDQGNPDSNALNFSGIPFEVHDTGEVWAAVLWDMREMLIMKDPSGVFFDGNRRLGNGTTYYIGDRAVKSVDTAPPIDYRPTFGTTTTGNAATATGPTATIDAKHSVRPGLIAAEIAQVGNRKGPIASALVKGAKLADTLVLRGLQLGLCNPSFVDSRDSILLADQQMNGGENRAAIWRAFASHGVGASATSTSTARGNEAPSSAAPAVVEDFTVPAAVTTCEASGPLASPGVSIVNTVKNTATLTLTPATGASRFYISRANSASGPYALITTVTAPATGTASYADNDGGSGLATGMTYYYRVRQSRDTGGDCVSQSKDADIRSITIGVGDPVTPNPVFAGARAVDDPQRCNVLNVSWSPASSVDPTAKLVYDVFRVASTAANNGTTGPTFTPATANKIQTGLAGTSFIDKNLTLNQPYYYIVRARDATTGRVDTANTGNLVVKYSAPSSPNVAATAPFTKETFEAAPATGRFTPALMESGATPNPNQPAWQRVTGVDFGGGVKSATMYAPDFDVPSAGSTNSDFSTMIGPITITANSVMSFDSLVRVLAGYSGGVVELSFTPNFNATPFPDNATTFDLGDYMTAGGYNGKLDGKGIGGAETGSALQGRRAFTGSRGLTRTNISLAPFAAGGAHAAPNGVYIRFRMTSTADGSPGAVDGWYVDNLAVTNLAACPANGLPTAVLKATPQNGTAPLMTMLSGAGSSDPDAMTNGDRVTSYTFDFGDGTATMTQASSELSHTYTAAGTYTASLTVTDSQGVSATASRQTITVAPKDTAPTNTAPMARLTADKTTGAAPLTVVFDASTSSDPDAGDAVTSYSFDFDGDDIYEIVDSSNAKPSKTYSAAGSYSVKAKVKDKAGLESAAVSLTITVTSSGTGSTGGGTTSGNRPPVAVLRAPSTVMPVQSPVSFDGVSSYDLDSNDGVVSLRFDFGDGTPAVTVTAGEVQHRYAVPGSYIVSLVATDTHGASGAAATQKVTIGPATPATPVAPVADGVSNGSGSVSRSGGGAASPALLALLGFAALRRRRLSR